MILSCQFTAEFAAFGRGIVGSRDALTGFQSVSQANAPGTFPHVADVFLVAYGLVGLVDGWRALGATPVAKARVPATVVVPALIAVAQGATGRAARALAGAAHRAIGKTTR